MARRRPSYLSLTDLYDLYELRIKPRLDFDGPIPPDPWRPVEGGCWLWTRGKFPSGYGSISIGNQTHLVHRIVFQAIHGSIPDDLFVDHVCRVRACVRHLEAVTPAETMARAQRPVCKNGHEFTPENTGPVAGHPNQRTCRACAREKTRRYQERQRARRAA